MTMTMKPVLAETFHGCSVENFETALTRYSRQNTHHFTILFNTATTLIATHNDVKFEALMNSQLLKIHYVPLGDMSLFHHAAKYRHDAAFQLLCELFPEYSENVLHPLNHTPLTECARSGYIFGAQKLLDLGCSVYRAKECKLLPIYNAGSSKMVRLLAKRGGPRIFTRCSCNTTIAQTGSLDARRTFAILSGDTRSFLLLVNEKRHLHERKRAFFSTSLMWTLLLYLEEIARDSSTVRIYQENR